MVRDTLGEDAVIVSTREERGGTIHVTAAVEPSYEQPYSSDDGDAPAFEIGSDASHHPHSKDWLQYDDEDEESAVIEEITDAMLRHGVSEDVLDHIISCATVIGFEQPGVALVAALEHLYNFQPLPQKSCKKPLMFVGPPGAGKTLAVAKQAARSVMKGLKVAVITTDTVRAGGVEQLQAFTKLLKTDLQKVETPEELAETINGLRAYDQILIDTPGINPFNKKDIRLSAQMIEAAKAEPILVLPGGIDTHESGDMARCFAAIGTTMLLPSRIDISRRLGGLLSAASLGSLTFTDASHTSKVADGLFDLTPQSMARLLMPQSVSTATPDSGGRSSSGTKPSQSDLYHPPGKVRQKQ